MREKSINFMKPVKKKNKHFLFLGASIFLFVTLASAAAIIGIKTSKTPKIISPSSKLADANNVKGYKSISFYIETSQELLNQARFTANSNSEQTEKQKQEIIEKVKKAINLASEGVDAYPADDRIYAQRAEIYSSLASFMPESLNFAVIDLTQAIAINSKNPDYHRRLANLHQQKQNYNGAASSFFNAYKLEPTNNQTLYNLAFSLEKAGQVEKAVQYYSKLITLLPQDNEDLAKIKSHKKVLEELIASADLKYINSPLEEDLLNESEDDYSLMGLEELPLEQAMAYNNLVIASLEETQNTSQDSKALINAKTGKGTLPQGKTEIEIKNTATDSNKRIVIAPTTNTENQILQVISKRHGEWFKVSIAKPTGFDIEFEYWIVD